MSECQFSVYFSLFFFSPLEMRVVGVKDYCTVRSQRFFFFTNSRRALLRRSWTWTLQPAFWRTCGNSPVANAELLHQLNLMATEEAFYNRRLRKIQRPRLIDRQGADSSIEDDESDRLPPSSAVVVAVGGRCSLFQVLCALACNVFPTSYLARRVVCSWVLCPPCEVGAWSWQGQRGRGRGFCAKRLCVPEVPKVCRACENMKEHLHRRGFAHLWYSLVHHLRGELGGVAESTTGAPLAVVEGVSPTAAAVVPPDEIDVEATE